MGGKHGIAMPTLVDCYRLVLLPAGELSENVNVLVWNTLEFPSLKTETLVVDGISPYCSEIGRVLNRCSAVLRQCG